MTDAEQLPEANFLNFLSGLGSQALIQLGEIPHPATGEREENLPFARYSLQLLEILQQKTEGNLTDEEAAYLRGMIGDVGQRLAIKDV